MKKLILVMSILFIINCSKKDTNDTSSLNNDSLVSDSTTAIPNSAPQTDSMSTSTPADSTARISSDRKEFCILSYKQNILSLYLTSI